MRKLICKGCGAEFSTKGKNVKYCSASCAAAAKKYQEMTRRMNLQSRIQSGQQTERG